MYICHRRHSIVCKVEICKIMYILGYFSLKNYYDKELSYHTESRTLILYGIILDSTLNIPYDFLALPGALRIKSGVNPSTFVYRPKTNEKT